MTAGVAVVETPFVAFTDDDAVPRPDWIEQSLRYFEDPGVGGVGGRDFIGGPDAQQPPLQETVGLLSRSGRMTGNHHLGTGPPRNVNVLKGVNCVYRSVAVAIPANLRGAGAQAHFEVGIGLHASANGWRLVYDPAVAVDHYPGPRFDADARVSPTRSAVFDAAYNLTFTIGSFGWARAARRVAFALMVGDRAAPGVLRAVAAFRSADERREVLPHLLPALGGNTFAAAQLARGRRLQFLNESETGSTRTGVRRRAVSPSASAHHQH